MGCVIEEGMHRPLFEYFSISHEIELYNRTYNINYKKCQSEWCTLSLVTSPITSIKLSSTRCASTRHGPEHHQINKFHKANSTWYSFRQQVIYMSRQHCNLCIAIVSLEGLA